MNYLFILFLLITQVLYAQTMPSLEQDLITAAGKGNVALVQALLEQTINLNATDSQGRTALTAAVAGNHLEVSKLLIDAGADPNLQDKQFNNALLLTGETGNVAILKEVLRAKPDLSLTNRFGGTALIPAADRGHVDYVRELLKTEINVNHINKLGWTALLEAVILGDGGASHTEIVRLLLDAGADAQIADKDGVTALEHAQTRGYTEIIRLLEENP